MNKTELPRVIKRWKKQKVRILAIAGHRKSGKDVLVEYLKKYKGVHHLRIAEAPVAIAKLLGLRPDRNIQHALFGVNDLLRPFLGGESAYKLRVARILDKNKPPLVVVESLRTKEEYYEFVVKRGGILIGLVAGDRLRFARARQDALKNVEKQDEARMSFKEFMARELVPIERDIDWIVERAHFVIKNDYKTRPEFFRDIEKAVVRLGLRKKK